MSTKCQWLRQWKFVSAFVPYPRHISKSHSEIQTNGQMSQYLIAAKCVIVSSCFHGRGIEQLKIAYIFFLIPDVATIFMFTFLWLSLVTWPCKGAVSEKLRDHSSLPLLLSHPNGITNILKVSIFWRNILGQHWLVRSYRFQEYFCMIRDLYIALYALHSKSNHLP